jgi:SNF2 family DNA or RNA helicase
MSIFQAEPSGRMNHLYQKKHFITFSHTMSRFDCKKKTGKSFSNIMMQLRKVVNHPYLFEEEYNIDENIYRVSGKFEVLDR